jgi:hypothetical protein
MGTGSSFRGRKAVRSVKLIDHHLVPKSRKMELYFQSLFLHDIVLWSIEHRENILPSFIHLSMALQSFVGLKTLRQFRNLLYKDGRTPWNSDQPVPRPLPATQTQTHRDIRASSGIRTHDSNVRVSEHSSCSDRGGHCDRHFFTLYKNNAFTRTSLKMAITETR